MDYHFPESEFLLQDTWHLAHHSTEALAQPHISPTTTPFPYTFAQVPQLSQFPYEQELFHAAPAAQHYAGLALLNHGDFNERMPSAPSQNLVVQSHRLPTVDDHNSTGMSVQQMPPPPLKPRKRKAPTLHNDDWDPVKDRVIELYITEDLPLPEVKKIVEHEFKSLNFTAT